MQFPHGEKLRFLVAGSATTAFTYVLYWTLLLAMDARIAYPIACVTGILLTYTLNSLWVFRRAWTRTGLLAFLLGYGLQTVLAYGIFLLLLAFTPIPAWFAPVVVTILLLPLTFLMNRWLVHRTSPHPEPAAGAPR